MSVLSTQSGNSEQTTSTGLHSKSGIRVRRYPVIRALLGAIFVFIAIFFSNEALARAIAGRPATDLSWGPALFRLLLGFHGLVLLAYRPSRSATPETREAASATDSRVWWIVGGLTVLALALRLWRLDTSLWLDEILTMVDFAKPRLGLILSSFPNQNQHMFYSVLSHFSMQVFGEHAWTLRLPAVFFGAATIPALFLAGRKIVGEREALLTCALLTVSYHHIWFSQNARGYSGLVFFTMLSTWLWMEALDRDRWRWWMFYAISCTLGLWIHMTMVFVVAGQVAVYAILVIFRQREARWSWRAPAAWILGATMTLQLYALSLPEFFRTAISEVSMPSEWTTPLWSLMEIVRGLQIGYSGAAVLLAGALMFFTGWLHLFRQSPRAGLIMTVPGILGAAFMLSSSHNLWPRFFLFMIGFGLLIAIHGAFLIPRLLLRPIRAAADGRLAVRVGMTAAGLLIAASAATVPRCYALPKQDFTGALAYVEQNRSVGDAVVTVGLAGHAYGKYYAPQWTVVETPDQLASVRAQHPRTLLVYTLGIELKAFHPELWRAVEAEFQTVRVFRGTLGGGEVYVCEERTPNRSAAAIPHE